MASHLALLVFVLCLASVLSRPEPNANLVIPPRSTIGVLWQQRKQGRYASSSNSHQLGIAKPSWSVPQVKSNKLGESELLKIEHSGVYPHQVLSQLEPVEQVLFLNKFSLLDPAQQLFALEMFSRVDQSVKDYAISQFLKLQPDILIRSLQAEKDKVAQGNSKQVKYNLHKAQSELWHDSALFVKVPIGGIYNIKINIELNIDDFKADGPDIVQTTTPGPPLKTTTTTTTTTTTIRTTTLTTSTTTTIMVVPPREVCEDAVPTETIDTGMCPDDWLTCPDRGKCVPQCRL